MSIPILREQTYTRVDHPDTLRGLTPAGDVRVRADLGPGAGHPINRWLQDGLDPWPGDPRLCLYVNTFCYDERPNGSWELWRLESDGRYHLHSDYDGRLHLIGVDFFWTLIDRFHQGDIRTGHDPLAAQAKRAEAERRSRQRDFHDYTEDIVGHYVWPAFKRAGRTFLRDGNDSPAR